jgi:hypothetical protein
VAIRRPFVVVSPAATIPPLNVEVAAEVERMFPPEMTIPWLEERPTAEIPPANEELETEVFKIIPPVIVRPFDEESPLVCTPAAKVEEAPPRDPTESCSAPRSPATEN